MVTRMGRGQDLTAIGHKMLFAMPLVKPQTALNDAHRQPGTNPCTVTQHEEAKGLCQYPTSQSLRRTMNPSIVTNALHNFTKV